MIYSPFSQMRRIKWHDTALKHTQEAFIMLYTGEIKICAEVGKNGDKDEKTKLK